MWQTVTDLLLNPEYLKVEIEKQRHKAEEDTQHYRDRLKAVKLAISDTKRKVGILIDQMLDDDLPKSILEERKVQLTKTLKSLQAEQAQIELIINEATITESEEDTLVRLTEELRRGLDNISFEDKRRVLQVLRIKVEVQNRKCVKLSSVLPLCVGHHNVDLILFEAPLTESKTRQ